MNKVYHYIICFLCWLALAISLVLVLGVITILVVKGIGAINVSFITQPATNFGKEGGVLYQIIGSLLMVSVAFLLSFPIAIAAALYKSEYLKDEKWQHRSDMLLHILNGIPSIVFGVFALLFFINICGAYISWWLGSLILAIMMLPILTFSSYFYLQRLSPEIRESCLALGLTKGQFIRSFLLKRSFAGAVSGSFLGLARILGETAPIMWVATIFAGAGIPSSWNEPVATLATHILILAQQANHPLAVANGWGASLILISLVFILAAIGFAMRRKQLQVQ